MDSDKYLQEITNTLKKAPNSDFITEKTWPKSPLIDKALVLKTYIPINEKIEEPYVTAVDEIVKRELNVPLNMKSCNSILYKELYSESHFFIPLSRASYDVSEKHLKNLVLIGLPFGKELTGILLNMEDYDEYLSLINSLVTNEVSVCIPDIHPTFYIDRELFDILLEKMSIVNHKVRLALYN